MEVVIDVEADDLNATKIWCIVCKRLDTDEVSTFVHGINLDSFASYAREVTHWIGHNILGFDSPTILRLLGVNLETAKITDTLILSRMAMFSIPSGHSLDAWGQRLNIPKGHWTDWSKYSEEMLAYCIQDTNVTKALYLLLKGKLDRFKCQEAIDVEHSMAVISRSMHNDGFPFDKEAAIKLYEELNANLLDVERQIQKDFPPRTVDLGLVCPKLTRYGTISRSNIRFWESDDLSCFSPGNPETLEGCFHRFRYEEFNPGSPKQVVERLEGWWNPTEQTDGAKHYDGDDEIKRAHFGRYGWKLSETNIATLRDEAPEGARLLVHRLFLASRLRSLTEWLNAYDEKDGRVHGTFQNIGAWTHRMSHSKPNMGNIATEKSIKFKSDSLSKLALHYGKEMRSLWTRDLGEESYLVGTDAEGIQLRIFAHYINDPKFIFAVTQGKKEDGTDPHSLNKQALGHICKSRDNAKTFIYAFLLGAGNAKVADILGCSKREATIARDNFISAYPGLAILKEEVIPEDALRQYFIGFDGRPVACDSEHLMLAGYLQNGEACIMKHANVLWRKNVEKESIRYRQVNFVHDEWQTIVYGPKSNAERVAFLQREAIRQTGEKFNLHCPFAGSSSIGTNWYETH